jgi:hypothetical protein
MKFSAKLKALLQRYNGKVRNTEGGQWLWINNKYVDDGYMALLGGPATLIYITLAKHASEPGQHCFPGQELIMQETGIKDRATITKHLKSLEQHHIIAVIRATRQVSQYLLLHPDSWRKVGNTVPEPTPTTVHESIDSKCAVEPHTNNTQDKNQLIKAVSRVDRYKSMLAPYFGEQDIDKAIKIVTQDDNPLIWGELRGLLYRWVEEKKIETIKPFNL